MLTLGKHTLFSPEQLFYEGEIHTGFWQNIGSGIIENPLGTYIFTFAELMEKYDGETMADTYVWRAELPTESESQTEATSIINIENGKTTSPKTGDGTSLLGLVGLLIGSLSIVFVLSKREKMK